MILPNTLVTELEQEVKQLNPGLIALRRQLHQIPELAYEEARTAALVAGQMRNLGFEVTEQIGVTGVLAILEGDKPGKTLMLRADLDGVDMNETPGREYGSTLENRNHCCGHDVNMAMVVGAAQLLARHRQSIAGKVAFVFQPADEPRTGAQTMIDDGLLDQIQPDAYLTQHVAPDLNAGQIAAHAGPVWASSDTLKLDISSEGPARGPRPEVAFIAAQVLTALYGVVSTERPALEAVTFNVSELEAHQTRREPAVASINMRLSTYNNELRSTLLKRIHEVVEAVCAGFGATATITISDPTPAIVNDAGVSALVEDAVKQTIGEPALVENHRHPVSDDFGLFLERAPGCLVLFGTTNAAKGITDSWHTPGYDADEDVLAVGALTHAMTALAYLEGD